MSRTGVKTAAAGFVRERVVRRLLPSSVNSNANRNDRVGAFHRAWGHVFTSQLEGAYYELGVYRGDAFRASWQVYRTFVDWQQAQVTADEDWRRDRARAYAAFQHHFYAFDTFEGLPDSEDGGTILAKGHFACSREEFARRNAAAGIVEGPNVRYFKGLFADVAVREREALASLQPAAVVNLDCDLYVSAVDALALVAPTLQQGTVLLADDWNIFHARRDQGERRAVREFLARRSEFEFEPWFNYEIAGQAFLVHQNAPPNGISPNGVPSSSGPRPTQGSDQ